MRSIKGITFSLLRPGAFWFSLLSLPASLPLLRGGYFASHDGLFHLYRLAGLDRALHHGLLYVPLPRLTSSPGTGYNSPWKCTLAYIA